MTGDLAAYVTKAEVDAALAHLAYQAERATGAAQLRLQRTRLFLRFLWLAGCRVSEALGVTAGDVDARAGVVRLATLKRRKPTQRAVPMPAPFLAEVVALGDRPFPWTRPHAYLLVHAALTAGGVDEARAHPHALRHGHAVHAVEAHVPLPVIQRVLGHASVTTTSVYLEVTGKDVRRYYDSIDW